MAETNVKNLIIGIIMFGIVMSAVVGVLSSIDDKLMGDRLDEFNNSFNILNDVSSATDDLRADVEASQTQDTGEAGWYDWIFGGTWTTIKQIFSSFSFFTTAIEDIAKFFDIPNYFIAGIIAIITTIITFGIIKAVTKTDV